MPINPPNPIRTDAGARTVQGSAREVFLAALRLGLTSFGGPIAHLGYFRDEYVVRRHWLEDHAYTELIGLCQFLPGPASSQVGFAIGWLRAGPLGALAAWVAFTLPSAVLMLGFALTSRWFQGTVANAAVHGLKITAVAVVAQAVIGMARTLTPDGRRIVIAAMAAIIVLLVGGAAVQLLVIIGGALLGLALCRPAQATIAPTVDGAPSRRLGLMALVLFALLLALLPILAHTSRWVGLASIFYRSGALVFGGGHVILPLLSNGLVPGWLAQSQFLAGYGATQAVPGPLFSIAAYLGATASPTSPLAGAVIATVAIFVPGLLLVTSALAFRGHILANRMAQRAMAGINAAVVGLLAAALYDPLWTTGIGSIADIIVVALALLLLMRFHSPPILVAGVSVAMSIAGL